jgi:hypothetical protein
MDGNGNTGSSTIAIGCNPECLVSKGKDSSPVGNSPRISLSLTVHDDPGIPVMGLGNLHAKQAGKFALVKIRDNSVSGAVFSLFACWHEHSSQTKNHQF